MNRRLFSALALAACTLVAAPSFAQNKMVMGVSVPAATHGWTGGVVYWANRTKAELEKQYPGISVIVKTAGSPAEQANQVQDLQTVSKIDTLVILPFESAPLTRPVAQVRVPELASLAETVEAAAALPQTVEVLLAGEREPRANARRAVRTVLDGHSAGVGLTQQPRAGRVAEGEAQRLRLDVESEITGREPDDLTVGDLEWRRRPAPRNDVGDLRRRARAQRDAHDARTTDRHRNRTRCAGEDQCLVSTLEARLRAGV